MAAASERVATSDSADAEAATGPPESAAPPFGTSGGFDLGNVGRDVAIEMHVTMASDDVQSSVEAIMREVATQGGGVASADIDYGTDEFGGSATLVVKVPPTGLDSLLDSLDRYGAVQSISQNAQDVTEQLVDLDVRIRNAEQSVDNVRGFMEQATDLGDLVTLESELTRRQTELEQLLARQRNISERVALSTVTVQIFAVSNLPEEPAGDPGISDGLSDGWQAFVAVLFAIAYVFAVLAPFLVIGAVVGLGIWLLIGRQRREQERQRIAGDLRGPAVLLADPAIDASAEPTGNPADRASDESLESANPPG